MSEVDARQAPDVVGTVPDPGLRDLAGAVVTPPGLVLTGPANASVAKEAAAETFARAWSLPYEPRRERTIAGVFASGDMLHVAVHQGEGDLRLYGRYSGETPFFYHPGVSMLRIRQLHRGERDRMLALVGDVAGAIILDATAGLCSDAAVWSYAAGLQGRCVATEASPAIALVVAAALQTYHSGLPELDRALRRIDLRCARWQDYKTACASTGSAGLTASRLVDIVYVDPMFTAREALASPGIAPLRPHALATTMTRADLEQMASLARRAVIVKDAWPGLLLDELGIYPGRGGRQSTMYGVLRLD
ncbi:MAG: class I SAM-dependent methyltransferase [Firmicutes bacterium]|nr:class I SAM-dependent methyltransferase [Bacillota bacterium]